MKLLKVILRTLGGALILGAAAGIFFGMAYLGETYGWYFPFGVVVIFVCWLVGDLIFNIN